MSNHLAIASITATLQRTLQATVQQDVDGARVTTVRPSDIGNGTPETGVNVFLYQIITNPALKNVDTPAYRSRSGGEPARRQTALDLYYMLSFYGNDNELAPQRLLGSVVRTLADLRSIPADLIRETCDDATFDFLQDSVLADTFQQLNIVPLDLNLEDLSKTWTVFFQTPYVLSIAYKVMVLLVEGETRFQRPLPVRERRSGTFSPYFNQPVIDTVAPTTGRLQPILTNSTLVIRGKFLKGSQSTLVRVGTAEVLPQLVKDTEVQLDLSTLDHLQAGIQSLQVLHPSSPQMPGDPRQPRVESNAAPFVLRPTVTSVTLEDATPDDDDLYAATVNIQLNVSVAPHQRIMLFLNEWNTSEPAAYVFDQAPNLLTEATPRLNLPIEKVKPGEYLVRVQIDGAESQLEVDDNPESETKDWFIGPRVQIG